MIELKHISSIAFASSYLIIALRIAAFFDSCKVILQIWQETMLFFSDFWVNQYQNLNCMTLENVISVHIKCTLQKYKIGAYSSQFLPKVFLTWSFFKYRKHKQGHAHLKKNYKSYSFKIFKNLKLPFSCLSKIHQTFLESMFMLLLSIRTSGNKIWQPRFSVPIRFHFIFMTRAPYN